MALMDEVLKKRDEVTQTLAKADAAARLSEMAEVERSIALLDEAWHAHALSEQSLAEARLAAPGLLWEAARDLLLAGAAQGSPIGQAFAYSILAAFGAPHAARLANGGLSAALQTTATDAVQASRRRDFTEGTRQAVLEALTDLREDSPFDVTQYLLWDEFKAECRRLVPDAYPYFDGMKEYNELFKSSLQACIDDVNRSFDDAQAVDVEYGNRIETRNASLRQSLADAQALTERLEAAAATIATIGG
jgi:hypothetical protein